MNWKNERTAKYWSHEKNRWDYDSTGYQPGWLWLERSTTTPGLHCHAECGKTIVPGDTILVRVFGSNPRGTGIAIHSNCQMLTSMRGLFINVSPELDAEEG